MTSKFVTLATENGNYSFNTDFIVSALDMPDGMIIVTTNERHVFGCNDVASEEQQRFFAALNSAQSDKTVINEDNCTG